MEYRRRRRRKGAQASSGGAAKAVIALLVVAAIVYIVSASAVGTWIAEKVIAPAFAAFDMLTRRDAPTPAPSAEPGALNLPQQGRDAGNSVTGEVILPSMESFALQMGVYSDKLNAQSEAASLQQRGAGGFVMEDAGRFRVLAAAYTSQESLKQVREQLTAEGIESASYVFSAPNSTLRVTAPEEQLSGISAGFETLSTLLSTMADETLAFDQSRKNVSEGKEAANTLLAELQAAKSAFLSIATVEHPVLDAAKTCFSEYETALQALVGYNTESFVDFSSKMKYTHISMVYAYATLCDRVAGL